MKHIVLIIGAVAALCILAFIFFGSGKDVQPVDTIETDPEVANEQIETAYGFSFGYAAGADGYSLVMPENAVRGDLVFTGSIFPTAALEAVPANSEYPPSLLIEVYRNPMSLDLEAWIKDTEHSNFGLSSDGTLQKKRLGGTEFLFYTHDGLYQNEVYAYAQEGFVYLFSNMWTDNDPIPKKDMEEVIASVEWSKPKISAQVAHGDITVSSPKFMGEVESPLVVEGMARGTWFFEASFPIILVDWDGRIIAEGYAQAQENWMTEELVPWKAEIVFTKPDFDERGYLILRKDNPSGLPENDDAIEIPILFK